MKNFVMAVYEKQGVWGILRLAVVIGILLIAWDYRMQVQQREALIKALRKEIRECDSVTIARINTSIKMLKAIKENDNEKSKNKP